MSLERILPCRHRDPCEPQLLVRKRTVFGSLRPKHHVIEADPIEHRLAAQYASRFFGHAGPCRHAGVDAVIQPGGRALFEQRGRRLRHVIDVTRSDRAIDEDAYGLAAADAIENSIDAALRPLAAEQALDAQDVVVRRLGGEPLAQ